MAANLRVFPAGAGGTRRAWIGIVPMSLPEYAPRHPGDQVLYRLVQTHFETYRAHAARLRDGEGLPRFVEDEFRRYLRCGWLAGGFARLQCARCHHDRLVAFSCKGRGFCPRCGGRRMAERAAHLIDHVLPDVPVRQWVLTMPYRLRYGLAWDHELCRAVAKVYMRAVLGWLQRRGRLEGVADGRGGAVVIIQRFGGALNLNVHLHALVLDGVFTSAEHAGPRFVPARPLTGLDVSEVLATVVPRVRALLVRRGLGGDDASQVDIWGDEAPALAEAAATSVPGLVTGGAGVTRPQRIVPDVPRRAGAHAVTSGPVAELRKGLESNARDGLVRLLSRSGSSGPGAQAVVTTGKASAAILKLARARSADLIVMGFQDAGRPMPPPSDRPRIRSFAKGSGRS